MRWLVSFVYFHFKYSKFIKTDGLFINFVDQEAEAVKQS